MQIFERIDLTFGGGGQLTVRLQIWLEPSDLVKHLVDVGNQVALHRKARQWCQLDDAETAGIIGGTVFDRHGISRMAETFVINHGAIRLFGPVLDGRSAQQGGGAVDGHGVGSAHAMAAGVAEGERRVDGAFDAQQAIKHRIFRACIQRIVLHPLFAARTAPRRCARVAEG